ncbi:MAG: BON domain-containing protein [Parvularculaceae bacterium]
MRWSFRRAAVAAAAFIALAGCASSRNLGDNVDDLSANAQLKAVLFADRKHDYSDIDLTIYGGRLMLTGTMLTEEGRRRLLDNAGKASGVEEVIDEVLVADHTSRGQGLEDSWIDQSIRARLLTSDNVTSANYKMSVSRGVVYLLGVARDEKELTKALEIARSTGGVETVVSHVIYFQSPPPAPAN